LIVCIEYRAEGLGCRDWFSHPSSYDLIVCIAAPISSASKSCGSHSLNMARATCREEEWLSNLPCGECSMRMKSSPRVLSRLSPRIPFEMKHSWYARHLVTGQFPGTLVRTDVDGLESQTFQAKDAQRILFGVAQRILFEVRGGGPGIWPGVPCRRSGPISGTRSHTASYCRKCKETTAEREARSETGMGTADWLKKCYRR
jgi:hypothetical protein